MGKIIFYLIAWITAILILLALPNLAEVPTWYQEMILFAQCSYIGALGGVLYCLRAVYLNKSVRKQWDPDWHVWYYLRPVTSTISGGISCVFLQAGLLTLDATGTGGQVPFGYLAVAFVAGYNVDNFLKRIESIAQTNWGIGKSRASKDIDDGSRKE